MSSFLHGFLAPNSIAIVGASSDPTKRGYKALFGLLKDGYEGAIYPINPKFEKILGVKVYPSIIAIPEAVDLALICTPANTLPAILEQCGANGIKGAIVLASGFAEAGEAGSKLEVQVLDAARKACVRIIGPNTSGIFNLHKKVNLLALDNVMSGNIGIISQSGNMLLALVLEAQSNGHIGFSTYVGPGNQVDISFADYLCFLGEEENTTVATFYIEGFQNGRDFLDVAREISQIKPVVVYKSGSTQAGQNAAWSHTGALSGSHAMTVDLLRQSGVNVVNRSDELLSVAQGLALLQKAKGKRVAILADGGGQATIASDRLIEAGLILAELGDFTCAALADILFPQASLKNPIDVAGSTDANPALFARCIEILLADNKVDMLFLVGMFGGYAIRFAEELKSAELYAAEAIVNLSKLTDKPILVYSLFASVKPQPLVVLLEGGIPVYGSIEYAVQVLAALAQRGAYLSHCQTLETRKELISVPQVRAVLHRAQCEDRNLFEFEARSILSHYDVDMLPHYVIRNDADYSHAIAQFGDMQLAIKIISKDILHKSDAGGVVLNLSGEAELRQGCKKIIASCRSYNSAAKIEGVLVTPMARKGLEIIIGVSRDLIFGPVLMFGLGGIFVELLDDVAFRAIPLNRHDAFSMVEQIKASDILEGARGGVAVDKIALVDLLLKVSNIVEMHDDINELDLNPVIAYANGYAVVDARVIVSRKRSSE